MKSKKKNMRVFHKVLLLLMICLISLGCGMFALAKADSSSAAHTLFFYALNDQNQSVLIKAVSIQDLGNELAHDNNGENYYFSYFDSLPTVCYSEGRGFTMPELINYINLISDKDYGLSYQGQDAIAFKSTDATSFDKTVWTYDDLYGVERYYYPGLYGQYTQETFETNKGGVDPDYTQDPNSEHYDKYFTSVKNQINRNALPAQPMLMTQSYSGRLSDIQDSVAQNSGVVSGCLADQIDAESSLRMNIPMTEQMIRTGERSAFDNRKWIYGIQLNMANPPKIQTQAVANSTIHIDLHGDIATITFDCETPGATVYHSLIQDQTGYTPTGAAQFKYDKTQPIKLDLSKISGVVNIHYFALKEGCVDSEVQHVTYPLSAPAFKETSTLADAVKLGDDVTFTAIDNVTNEQWTAWTTAITSIEYALGTDRATLRPNEYTVDNSKRTITIAGTVFKNLSGGKYTFTFLASGYANKAQGRNMNPGIPEIRVADSYAMGEEIKLVFDDLTYQGNATVKIKDAQTDTDSMFLQAAYLDRTQPGQLRIKADYYQNRNCVITQKGTYTLIINNSNYLPGSQTVNIVIGDETVWPQEPLKPVLTYTLDDQLDNIYVGDAIEFRASLKGEDAFTLYSAQYCVQFDEAAFGEFAVECAPGWQSQISSDQNQTTTITFLYLNIEGVPIAKDGISFGTINAKALSSGTHTISVDSAIAGDKNATSIDGIIAYDLQIISKQGVKAEPNYDAGTNKVTVAVDRTILPPGTSGTISLMAALYHEGRMISIDCKTVSVANFQTELLTLNTNGKTDFYVKLFLTNQDYIPLIENDDWQYSQLS